MSQLTACIKTHLRYEQLGTCLRSVFQHLPDADIIVCDDSGCDNPMPELKDKRVNYIRCPYDIGISAGRNIMMLHVQTPYVLMLDDDHILLPETKAEQAVRICEVLNRDMVGMQPQTMNGEREYWSGFFRVKNSKLFIDPIEPDMEAVADYYYTHLTPHPFIAKADAVRNVKWDSELKICEHWDFHFRFMKAGYRALLGLQHRVAHNRGHRGNNYLKMRRQRAQQFKKLALQKHGLKEIVFT